jgi:hypothetical protein
MASVRVKLNSAGFRQLLNSEEVQAVLQEKGDEVAARAAAGTKERATGMRNPDYSVRVVPGKGRAACFVWAANTNSFLAEKHDRALSKAFG